MRLRRRLLSTTPVVSIVFILLLILFIHRYLYVWFGVSLIPTEVDRSHHLQTSPSAFDQLYGWGSTSVARRQPSPSRTVAHHDTLARRSLDYCNALRPVASDVITDDGRLPDGLHLVGVVIMTRHGHRAPMYSLPNYHPLKLNCHMRHVQSSPTDRDQALQFASAMDALAHESRNATSPVDPAWRRYGLYPASWSQCNGAQLTADGALQMIRLGLLLRTNARYHQVSHAGVEVHSSQYSRTVQSAAALLYGLGGMSTGLIVPSRVRLTRDARLCLEDTASVMCDCQAARVMMDDVRRHTVRSKDLEERTLRREVATVFNVSSSRLPWTAAILEVLMSEFCINSTLLPCDAARHHCLSLAHLDRMWRVVDQHGRRDVTDPEMGRASLLLAFPLLADITARLRGMSAADLGSATPSAVRDTAHLVVYSGHDKTLTSLITGLGLHAATRWPSFGARLIFELSADDRSHYYFRLLYDGRDMTSSLGFCRKSSVQAASGGACPLNDLISAVLLHTAQWFGFTSHIDACRL